MNSRRRAAFVLSFLYQFLASQKKKEKKTSWNIVIHRLTVWRTCDLSLDQELWSGLVKKTSRSVLLNLIIHDYKFFERLQTDVTCKPNLPCALAHCHMTLRQ